jgi:hypothetical protein
MLSEIIKVKINFYLTKTCDDQEIHLATKLRWEMENSLMVLSDKILLRKRALINPGRIMYN